MMCWVVETSLCINESQTSNAETYYKPVLGNCQHLSHHFLHSRHEKLTAAFCTVNTDGGLK